ncbi:MAG: hypothetical protein LBJ67_10025 [Planctomycetaceae bacterium]|nr:hypothetical protein [Planctomycetaceae bacterium]
MKLNKLQLGDACTNATRNRQGLYYRNFLIGVLAGTIFFAPLLPNVYAITDCEQRCLNAYNRALEKCAQDEQDQINNVCTPNRDTAIEKAEKKREQDYERSNEQFNNKKDDNDNDLKRSQKNCESTFEHEMGLAAITYSTAIVGCFLAGPFGGACIIIATTAYVGAMAECINALGQCNNGAQEAYTQKMQEAKRDKDLSQKNADEDYTTACNEAQATFDNCCKAANAARKDCENNAKSNYDKCIEDCEETYGA